ncbi:MAG TPA: energy transducer TonB [Cyclobacteriaceae bacterium]
MARVFLTMLLTTFFIFDSLGQFRKGRTTTFSQEYHGSNSWTEINPQKSAEFHGGMGGLYKYINKKLRYPRDAKKNNIQGKVMVTFVVGKDGNIKQESIKITSGLFPSCDEEALRIIRKSPTWIPGINLDNNEPIETKYVVPIIFHR